MKKYTYETVTLGYALSKRSLAKKLQDVLDEKSSEGWRLVKFDFPIGLAPVSSFSKRNPNSFRR